MKYFTILNDWTDLGWLTGYALAMALLVHWSHWITMVIVIILTILMRKQNEVRGK